MEEMNRTHKEPAWGWIGALRSALSAATPAVRPTPGPAARRQVVTPWSPRSNSGWSA